MPISLIGYIGHRELKHVSWSVPTLPWLWMLLLCGAVRVSTSVVSALDSVLGIHQDEHCYIGCVD